MEHERYFSLNVSTGRNELLKINLACSRTDWEDWCGALTSSLVVLCVASVALVYLAALSADSPVDAAASLAF